MKEPYLIKKEGMWYAHNSRGYVARAELAELYSEEYAKSHANAHEGCLAVPVSELFNSVEALDEYIDRLQTIREFLTIRDFLTTED